MYLKVMKFSQVKRFAKSVISDLSYHPIIIKIIGLELHFKQFKLNSMKTNKQMNESL
jgi:hypothetical protein